MSDKQEYYASASVTITLRVRSKGHWGKDATVAEVMRIGGRETIDAVKDALVQGGLSFETIGEPKVGAVTWEPQNG